MRKVKSIKGDTAVMQQAIKEDFRKMRLLALA